jgi:glycosyltransferase involved in cell wall biosynthesis
LVKLRRRRSATAPRHVCIIVQNLPVPFDRRVWLECRALRDAGYDVSVVCPKGPGDPSYAELEGVALYKYRGYTGAGSSLGYISEYVYSFSATAFLVAKAYLRKPFHALQACNPPDIFWPIGLVFRLLGRGVFVFDHHDLCPELYQSRFEDQRSPVYRLLRATEWCTFHTANHVISTNESYQSVARGRGGKRQFETTVVRTGPDPSKLKKAAEDASLRKGATYLAAYIGVMGPQDGVDIVVRVAEALKKSGREDVRFIVMGSGDCFDELVALRDELGLGDTVEFTGRVPDEVVSSVLSTADVGLSPDPLNPLNDLSTMNKTMEYMAFALPTVAFDLRETRVSAGEAAVYAQPNEIDSFAKVLLDLLEDEPRRKEMGALARRKVEEELAWSHQRDAYVAVYDRLLGGSGTLQDA